MVAGLARAAKTVNRSLNSMARERPRDNEKCYCAQRIRDMRYSKARILRVMISMGKYIYVC